MSTVLPGLTEPQIEPQMRVLDAAIRKLKRGQPSQSRDVQVLIELLSRRLDEVRDDPGLNLTDKEWEPSHNEGPDKTPGTPTSSRRGSRPEVGAPSMRLWRMVVRCPTTPSKTRCAAVGSRSSTQGDAGLE